MENKNNKLVIFLLIVIICLLAGGGFLGYTLLSDKANSNVNLGGSENNNNQLAGENNNADKKDITLEFVKFASSKNWEIRSDAYDWDSLRDENCTLALSAVTGKEFSLELYKYSNESGAKKQYEKQNEYQLDINSVKQEIVSNGKNNYNHYEAILIPQFEGPLPIDGVEIYLYELRIDNYYISFYEQSTNPNKTALIKLVEELKTVLGVK